MVLRERKVNMLRADGKIQRCQWVVYKPDVPRYSGHGPSGFSMHYNEEQCSYKAVAEVKNTYGNPIKVCSRHRKMADRWCMTPCRWDYPWEKRNG